MPLLPIPKPKPSYRGASGQMSGLEYIRPDPGYTRDSVLKQQRFLRNMGYAIPVDGKIGPLTQSALNDWHAGKGHRNPQAWSAKLKKVHDPNHDNSGVTSNNQRNQPAHSGSNNLKAKNARVGSRPAGNFGGDDGYLSNDALNPDVLANAMVESEYGPLLAEIQRQEKRIRTGGPARLNQIDKIYSDLSGQIRTRNTANAGVSQRLQTQTETGAASLASALGLAAADPSVLATVGASTSIESDFLRDIGAADEQYGNSLLSSASAEQAAARAAATAEDTEQIDELESMRTEYNTGRESALVNARMKALEFAQGYRSNQLKDKLAMFNANLAMQQAPLQQQQALQDLMSGALGMDLTRAQIGATNRSNMPDAPAAARRNFQQLGPDERLTLQDSILSRVSGVKGTQNKVKLINSMLRGAGYSPTGNKFTKRFAFNTAKAAGLYPSMKWWGSGR